MKINNLIKCWEGHTHLLKYQIGSNEIVDYQIRTINECGQSDFIKISNEKDEFLSYEVTSLIPLNTYFQNYCDVHERIKRLFISYIEALEESEHYLLNLENIIIEEQYSFFDIEGSKIKLVYLPIKCTDFSSVHEKVKAMFLGLIFKNIDMNYIGSDKSLISIIDKLQDKDFDIYIFKQLILNNEEKKEVIEIATPWLKKLFGHKTKKVLISETKQAYNAEDNRTIMLETIETLPCLEFSENQKVTINKDRFLIGRSNQLVDFSLPEELGLGRVHAEIVKENQCYYIIDVHTKNGTFINGSRIISQKKYEINVGDELKFANKTARFL